LERRRVPELAFQRIIFLMQFPVLPSSSPLSSKPRTRTASIWQAGLSLMGAAGLLALALNFTVRGLSWISLPQIARSDITGSFLLAASMALGGCLLLPSAGFALARLNGWPIDRFAIRVKINPWIFFLMLGASFFTLLTVGAIISQSIPLAWFLLPIIHILVIGIPVAGILYLGGRGLPVGSPQRVWGVFGAGMTLGPGLIFVLEIIALLIVVFMGAIFLAAAPDQYTELSRLIQQLQTGNLNPNEILQILQPYLQNPVIILGALIFMSGIVPILEEGLKPLGFWLLVKRRLTPAEGFTAGLLSGAGFALVESLGYTSTGSQGWMSSVLLRAPTALMHITACGLTGWGVAKAITLRQVRWLLAGYGGAVAIHGLWNGLTLTAAGIMLIYPDQPSSQIIAGLALLGMILLFSFTLVLLILINHRLRMQAAHAIIPPGPVLGTDPDTNPSESESSLHEYNP
jgi:RsiW-degrading membrane proteinase PrsW (M82 family)